MITVKELLAQNGLLAFAEKYTDFVKLFNHKISVLSEEDNRIEFIYRGTQYISRTTWMPQYNQYCSTVYKATQKNPIYQRCRCNTRYEESTYPVLGGFIATVLTDRKNNQERAMV